MPDININKKIEKIPSINRTKDVEKSPELHDLPENQVEQQEQLIKQAEVIDFDESAGGIEVANPGGIVSQGNAAVDEEKNKKEIERVLEEDMADIYLRMTPGDQEKFKIKGEETIKAVYDLVSKGKATLKKLVKLIRDWLLVIPGINKYFLEQEAKLKADEILGLTKEDN